MEPRTTAKSAGGRSATQAEALYSYDESVDEPAPLIDDEPVEVKMESPAGPNEPVEGGQEHNGEAPVFEG